LEARNSEQLINRQFTISQYRNPHDFCSSSFYQGNETDLEEFKESDIEIIESDQK
jgi:hypothetical protein